MTQIKNIKGIDKRKLEESRKNLHQAIQLIGAFPRNFLTPDPTDASASLLWNKDLQALESILVGKYQLGLSFADFSLYLSEAGSVKETVKLDGISVVEAMSQLVAVLSKYGLSGDQYNLELPYEIESYDYNQPLKVDTVALSEFSILYANTNEVLIQVVSENVNAYDIRCWPHHFDLATLIPLKFDGNGELQQSIGVGLSPGDEGIDEPYLYVNIWPNVALAKLQKHSLNNGNWNLAGWSGAVLRYTSLLSVDNQEESFVNFIMDTISTLKKVSSILP